MPDDLKIFISWSGSLANLVALELESLLAMTSDLFKPFVSSQSIESGERGMEVIADQLKSTRIGLVVVTKENWRAPWLNYEAGAISREVGNVKNRVIPLLVDLEGSDFSGSPLIQFQYRRLDRPNMERVVQEIARIADVDPGTAVERMGLVWDRHEAKISAAIGKSESGSTDDQAPGLTDSDILREVLELTRTIARNQLLSATVSESEASPLFIQRSTFGTETSKARRTRQYVRSMVEELTDEDGSASALLRGATTDGNGDIVLHIFDASLMPAAERLREMLAIRIPELRMKIFLRSGLPEVEVFTDGVARPKSNDV